MVSPQLSSSIRVGLRYGQTIVSLKILFESRNWKELREDIIMLEDHKDLKLMGIADSKLPSKQARSHESSFASRLLSLGSTSPFTKEEP